nr:Ig-like domain-containing protein [Teredinibacter franksiae]
MAIRVACFLCFFSILTACGGDGDPASSTPTAAPTTAPTTEPTAAPTAEPTAAPTTEPTAEPTTAPNGDRVTSIVLSASNIDDGLPQQIEAVVSPSNAANPSVSWSVDDTSIATISSDGVITPKMDGAVTVTAMALDGSETTDTVDLTIQLLGSVVDSESAILSALSGASAGSIIYIRGGSYQFSSKISLSKNGSSNSKIGLRAYPYDSERPLFDFSAMSENSSNRGLALSGDYWHIYGIDVYKAGDNCLNISGDNNTVEFSTFYECADTGLQLGNGASNNLILNSDSYFNADSSNENADGFAAKLDVGTGNRFVGCRAWNNLDDGWDGYLRPVDGITTTYENCWAIDNGKNKSGTVGLGDGNGFKTGGSDTKDLSHNAIYKNCIAAGNVHDGFDHNSNRGEVTLLNCAAHSNGRNINFSSSNIAASLTIKNTVSFSGSSSDSLNATMKDITFNSWQNGLSASSADFESVDTQLLKAPRKSDGSLPDIDYLKLKVSSDLIDAGVDVNLPYNGSQPDVGAFESD